ncbi:molybdopterin binding oxidoreductase-like protein [Phanerochaete sordida]|uniref:Molybdopterin binding oxidoreductase-like protein n=1 Tax=Phanerochaete sordida TaxID=48140 RepID=A0A9P3GQB8_9APHY|nr:molybdopterin binding oxidoreductase-like protein [Phanerochaete sordida]
MAETQEGRIVHQRSPLNAEPPLQELVAHPLTPEELVYARNHGPIEHLDAATFKLKVDGLVEREAEYTLEEIQNAFPKAEVVAALQCAGNRRGAMQDKKDKPVEGVLWGQGTIANVRWGGVRLRDLLRTAGVRMPQGQGAMYACFASHVTACEQDDWFGASIPLEKALSEDGDALLAYEMNGKPLKPEHGFPFRVVIPGYSGARWVKWVDQVTVSHRESDNFYQQRDYKVLPPEVQTREQAEHFWSKVPPILANPLNSVVASADAFGGHLTVKGYAVSGPAGQVARVCVSVDDGASWQPAQITYQEGRWSWTLWEATVRLPGGEAACHGTVYSRAEDMSGHVQPKDTDWNLRGVVYHGYGEMRF